MVDERLKILVVEDDPVYAEFVASHLRAHGHAVNVVESGAAARFTAATDIPDAVFLDLGLPDEPGYDVARALRRRLPASSIIIVLTADRFPERDTAEAVGVDLVLSKPVDASVVLGVVKLVRDRRRRRLGPL